MFRRWIGPVGIFALGFFLFFSLFQALIPVSDAQLKKSDFLTAKTQEFRLVALGDSLTEGVGDTTNQGGYVPLVAQSLSTQEGYQVKTWNFGVAGNTSKQILNRLKKKNDIQSAVQKADMLALTIGGNDIMGVIKNNVTDLSLSSFDKPRANYQKRLQTIIDLARQDNANLPIYIFGVYNPFYLNFPEMTQMQEVIDQWNQATEEVAAANDQVYFVAINDLLYKGINGEEGVVQSDGQQETIINDALFSDDHFHPNNIGYQLMAQALMETINETHSTWKN